MSSGSTPALRKAIRLAVVPGLAGDGVALVVADMPWKGLLTRPATDMMWMGRCRRWRARSAEVTIRQVALSVSMQQSSRWQAGFTIQREPSTSSTVTRVL